MFRYFYRRVGVYLPALLIGFTMAVPLSAVEPEIRNVSLRGLQINGTTTLAIDGDNFGVNPRLLLPFSANVSLKPKSTDKQATFEVALGNEVVPGYYHLRVVTDHGVSLPNVIAVDRFPQRAFAPSIEQLPAALHGTLTGSTVVETSFPGKVGQKITVEIEAQRLGNKLRPVVHLYGPKKLQLAWAWGTPSLQGDTRLEATLPEDGTYRIALHDGEYAGPAPGFFRLRVGNWSYVDHVFPAVVGKETNSVEVIGSASGRIDVPATRTARWLPLAWPKEGLWSGPRPFVERASRTEVLQQSASAKPQELPAGSVGVSGRLLVPYEEDRYRVPVVAGSKVRFEVFAERIGAPIDAALVIRNESGVEVARVEDSPGTLDPLIEYTVPANVSAVIVGVVDSQGRGGPRGLYRLTVDPGTAVRNDFELVTPARRIAQPVDGRTVVPVWVERRGYSGAIDLAATGMPTGMKLDGLKIPPGADGTLVTITLGAGPVNPAIAVWIGRTDDGREQAVVQKNNPVEKLQPWLASEIAFAGSSSKGTDLQIDWKEAKADDALVLSRRRAFVVKITRPGPITPVRLTLLTSQLPIVLNNVPDPNRNIRFDKPVELATAEGEIGLLIPADLAGEVYDIVIQAEALTADKKTVTAIAYTPVRRLPVRVPLTVKLESPVRIDVKTDAKTAGSFEIVGTVQRLEGITGDVQMALTGLPAGIVAAPLTVKAGTDPFKLKVNVPVAVPAGEIKGLKLSATIVPDPKAPAQRVKSRDVDLTLNILKAK